MLYMLNLALDAVVLLSY